MAFLKSSKIDNIELSDNDLVQAIIDENDRTLKRNLQEALYDRYADRIFSKCYYMVKDRDIAKDLSHDIFVKVFINLTKFRGDSPFYGWIYAIAYNHCINHLEKSKRLKLDDFEAKSYEIASDDTELEYKILKDIQLTQLEKLMGELPEAERMILLMRYQDGLSVKEVATMLNLGESAVKMRLKRSRDHLAELFKESGYEPR